MSFEEDIFKSNDENEIFAKKSKITRSPQTQQPTYAPLFDEFGNKTKSDTFDQNIKNSDTFETANNSINDPKLINDEKVTIRRNQRPKLNLNLEENLNKKQEQSDTSLNTDKEETPSDGAANSQNEKQNVINEQQRSNNTTHKIRHNPRKNETFEAPQSAETYLIIEYRLVRNSETINQQTDFCFAINPNVEIPTIHQIFTKAINDHFQEEERNILTHSLNNWSLSDMADIPIKDITDLIKEYKGDEKELNAYVKNIDRLWKHIENYTEADKNRFLLILQLKLIEKAAEATKEIQFENWEDVKKALKENINPQKNIEKAELKLNTIKQSEKEDVETYAKRVEDLLENLNKSFDVDAGNEIIKKENDRKARKAFENGLFNRELRDKAITRGNKTFKESVDYVTEQELRQSEFKTKGLESLYCNYCKTRTHNTQDCRTKRNSGRNSQDNRNNREITCYKCNKRGHYSSECRSASPQNSPNTSRNMNETHQRPQSPNNSNRNFNSNRNDNYNNRNSSPHTEQRGNRDNRNIRTYDHELPIEEAVVYAELTEDRKN